MDTPSVSRFSARPGLIIAVVAGTLAVAGVAHWVWRAMDSPESGELTLSGTVDIRQVSLAFNATERIAELRVQEGDHVRAGEVVAELDQRTTRVRLAQTEAQIGVHEAALQRLQNGSRPEEIAQARANAAVADAEAALTTRQVERLQAVHTASDGKAVSQQDIDTALSQQKATRARAESARAAQRLVTLGARPEDRAQAAKQLAAARAERGLIQRQLEDSELRAPVEAVVRARLLEPGDMASPLRPVYTLAITQPKWVRAYVPEIRLGQIPPGHPATVTTDSDARRGFPARVGYISSVAEFTPKSVQTEELRTSLVYEVRFLVDDPDDVLRLGMPATVHLTLRNRGMRQSGLQ